MLERCATVFDEVLARGSNAIIYLLLNYLTLGVCVRNRLTPVSLASWKLISITGG